MDAADGMADFDTTDDERCGARGPVAEADVDERAAEEVEESFPEVSAWAVSEVMMATAVPIPSSAASAPTRPIDTA